MAETTARDFESLSAYVDGALPVNDAAVLAARISNEPGLARAAARLTALKAASAARLPDDPPTPQYALPTKGVSASSLSSWRRMRLAAVAAGLCAVVTGGALATFALHEVRAPDMSAPGPAPIDALALHDAWGAAGGMRAPLATFDEERRRIMAATDLSPAFARNGVPGAGAFRQEGYVGANGCRVSVFLAPFDTPLSLPSVAGDALAASWQRNGERVLLVARTMDALRFAKLGAALRDPATFDGERGDLIASLRSRMIGCPA